MIHFKRTIDKVDILIGIDTELHSTNRHIFDCILTTFNRTNGDSNDSFVISLHNSTDEDTFFCDTNSNNWVFKLLDALENYFARKLNCTVVHGSCIRIFNKNILVVGSRMSGKTTLTQFFSSVSSADYMTDDCIYIVENKYYGFALPIPMRSKQYSNENIVCISNDFEDEERVLYFADKRLGTVNNVDIVLFPKYREDMHELAFVNLQNSKLYNMITQNVRHIKNIKNMFYDVNQLVKNSIAYYIEYSSCEDVLLWLEKQVYALKGEAVDEDDKKHIT